MGLTLRASGFWNHRGFWSESVRWAERLLDVDTLSRADRSAGHAILAEAVTAFGDAPALHVHMHNSIEYADGKPHDWVPSIASVLALLAEDWPAKESSAAYQQIALDAAERSSTPSVELSNVAAMRGHIAHWNRQFEQALVEFRLALSLCSEPGRNLLSGEIGEGWSIYSLGRFDEAMDCVRGWGSSPDTDEFHYLVHIARAIIEGGAGEPWPATKKLGQVVSQMNPASLGGWVDDFNFTFGMLADYRGERDLAETIFERGKTRNHLLFASTADHLVKYRCITTTGGWYFVSRQIFVRPYLSLSDKGTPTRRLIDVCTAGIDLA